ncbi:unnamed protein product [Choristocarpus tenellus]
MHQCDYSSSPSNSIAIVDSVMVKGRCAWRIEHDTPTTSFHRLLFESFIIISCIGVLIIECFAWLSPTVTHYSHLWFSPDRRFQLTSLLDLPCLLPQFHPQAAYLPSPQLNSKSVSSPPP